MGVTPQEIRDRMDVVRTRTLELMAPLDAEGLGRQVDPILSPPIWDLAHIAAQEELWLVRTLTGRDSIHPEFEAIYNAVETPRSERGAMDLLEFDECVKYLDAVREQAFEVLEQADLSPGGEELTAEGYVFEMMAEHEAQHTETLLQALKMMEPGDYVPANRRELPARQVDIAGRVEIPGGEFEMGAPEGGFVYDCERPQHTVSLDAFWMSRHPVTIGEYLDFMADGGYSRRELWDPDGWQWATEANVQAPMYWEPDGDGWAVREFERTAAPDPEQPVCHVSWYEADACARWAGGRLPTEAEWERAAQAATDLRPHANLDQLAFRTAPCGAYPDSETSAGCLQMFGDAWEWTSSTFSGYPGFRHFPYPEYSEIFFDGPYRSLRGGGWATQPHAVRTTFRNWDRPLRRQIFSGLRMAWDQA